MEWVEYDNGDIVTKRVSITHVTKKPNFIIHFRSETPIELHTRPILIEMKRPKYLDYVFKGNGIVARGTLTLEDDTYSLKIMKPHIEQN